MDTDQILHDRGRTYGKFKDNAETAQELKRVMVKRRGWARMSDVQREALSMIQHKIARLLNGDPNHIDGWDDIAGYAKLVSKELNEQKQNLTLSIGEKIERLRTNCGCPKCLIEIAALENGK